MTKDEILSVGPVPTAENVADLGTEPLKAERISKLLAMLGIRCAESDYASIVRARMSFISPPKV